MREALIEMALTGDDDRRFHAIVELRMRYGGVSDGLTEHVARHECDPDARAIILGEVSPTLAADGRMEPGDE